MRALAGQVCVSRGGEGACVEGGVRCSSREVGTLLLPTAPPSCCAALCRSLGRIPGAAHVGGAELNEPVEQRSGKVAHADMHGKLRQVGSAVDAIYPKPCDSDCMIHPACMIGVRQVTAPLQRDAAGPALTPAQVAVDERRGRGHLPLGAIKTTTTATGTAAAGGLVGWLASELGRTTCGLTRSKGKRACDC